MYKNAEGYSDPTPGAAYRRMHYEERLESERTAAIGSLMSIIRQAAALAGFEIVGRITFRDKATGKEYL